jgi:hypothetical protein
MAYCNSFTTLKALQLSNIAILCSFLSLSFTSFHISIFFFDIFLSKLILFFWIACSLTESEVRLLLTNCQKLEALTFAEIHAKREFLIEIFDTLPSLRVCVFLTTKRPRKSGKNERRETKVFFYESLTKYNPHRIDL